MNNNILGKTLAIGIIILFIGTTFLPSISGNINKNDNMIKNKLNEVSIDKKQFLEKSKSEDDIDIKADKTVAKFMIRIENKDVGNTEEPINKRTDENFEYIIITIDEFMDEFQELAEWKKTRAASTPYSNLNTTVVLLENIVNNSNYWYNGYWGDGGDETIFNDTQCIIRNFIKMAYCNWSTKYVLLGGDGDLDEPVIPARFCDDIACDMYYGCLDGNWNKDSDGVFGEKSWIDGGGGMNGEEADFFAEVHIGRAPADSVEEVNNFINKTIAYESTSDDEYLKKAMMIADYSNYGAKTDYVSEIIPQYTTKKFYLREGNLNKSRILEEMNTSVHIVVYIGHSGITGFIGLDNSDVVQLTNTNYFFMLNGGCHSGNFTYDDAISEEFVVSSGGAFAYIGNSVVSITHGVNNMYTLFFTNLMNQSTTHIGKILHSAKEEYITEFEEDSDSTIRRGCFMLNLFGDPETQLKTNISAPTAHFTTEIAQGNWIRFPSTYNGTLVINGIAKRGNSPNTTFNHYVIEYGEGFEPDTWISKGIGYNGSIEIDGILGLWDTRNHDDGPYTLRLTVYDEDGRVGQDWIRFFVVNTFSVRNVDTDTYYTTIQDAINEASNGDTIFVGSRTYYENIHINKSVTLIGEDKESTIIDGWGVEYVILIKVEPFDDPNPSIEIKGFTIQNSRYGEPGIKIIGRCYGFACNASNVTIRDNIIRNNYYGIMLSSIFFDNEIFHNNFINNYQHAVDQGDNLWYNETLQEGNYWDDYTDIDADGDGIGDTPYNIYDVFGLYVTNQDLFPLIAPYYNSLPDINLILGKQYRL